MIVGKRGMSHMIIKIVKSKINIRLFVVVDFQPADGQQTDAAGG